MASESPRFWPNNPGQSQQQDEGPAKILRVAAEELEGLTKGQVTAELRDHMDGEDMRYDFYLVAARVNYRYLLFRASLHGIGFPVTVFDRPGDEVESGPPFGGTASRRSEHATPEELEAELKRIFELESTNQVINQLRNL